MIRFRSLEQDNHLATSTTTRCEFSLPTPQCHGACLSTEQIRREAIINFMRTSTGTDGPTMPQIEVFKSELRQRRRAPALNIIDTSAQQTSSQRPNSPLRTSGSPMQSQLSTGTSALLLAPPSTTKKQAKVPDLILLSISASTDNKNLLVQPTCARCHVALHICFVAADHQSMAVFRSISGNHTRRGFLDTPTEQLHATHSSDSHRSPALGLKVRSCSGSCLAVDLPGG
jgi:hypothetical protein